MFLEILEQGKLVNSLFVGLEIKCFIKILNFNTNNAQSSLVSLKGLAIKSYDISLSHIFDLHILVFFTDH